MTTPRNRFKPPTTLRGLLLEDRDVEILEELERQRRAIETPESRAARRERELGKFAALSPSERDAELAKDAPQFRLPERGRGITQFPARGQPRGIAKAFGIGAGKAGGFTGAMLRGLLTPPALSVKGLATGGLGLRDEELVALPTREEEERRRYEGARGQQRRLEEMGLGGLTVEELSSLPPWKQLIYGGLFFAGPEVTTLELGLRGAAGLVEPTARTLLRGQRGAWGAADDKLLEAARGRLNKAVGEGIKAQKNLEFESAELAAERATIARQEVDALEAQKFADVPQRGQVAIPARIAAQASTPPPVAQLPSVPQVSPPMFPSFPDALSLPSPRGFPVLTQGHPQAVPSGPLGGPPTVGRHTFARYRGELYEGIHVRTSRDKSGTLGAWAFSGWQRVRGGKSRFAYRPLPYDKTEFLQTRYEGLPPIETPPPIIRSDIPLLPVLEEEIRQAASIGDELGQAFSSPVAAFLKLVDDKIASPAGVRDSLGMAADIPNVTQYKGLRRLILGRWAPIRNLPAAVQHGWNIGALAQNAKHIANRVMFHAMRFALEDAFGKDFFYIQMNSIKTGAKPLLRAPEMIADTDIRALLTSAEYEAAVPWFGKPMHILEYPEFYKLIDKQKTALKYVEELLNKDFRTLVDDLRIPADAVEGLYLRHRLLDAEGKPVLLSAEAPPLQVRQRKPGMLQPRERTLHELLVYAKNQGAAVDSQIANLFWQRLGMSAQLHGDVVFLDGLAAQTFQHPTFGLLKGRRLAPEESVGRGMMEVKQAGQRWEMAAEYGHEANKILDVVRANRKVDSLDIINELRSLLLNLDLSIIGARQGVIGLMIDPVAQVRAWRDGTMMMLTPEGRMMGYATHYEGMIDASRHGLNLTSQPITDLPVLRIDPSSKVMGGIERLPGLRDVYAWQFNYTFPLMKYMAYQRNLSVLIDAQTSPGIARLLREFPLLGEYLPLSSVEAVAKLKGETAQMSRLKHIAADATNNAMGGLNWAKIGTGEAGVLTRLAILTPGWTRAQLGLLATAANPFSPEGILARRLIAREHAFAVMLGVGGSYLAGGELSFDPRSNNFGVIDIPGKFRVPIDPYRPLMRMVARGIGGIPEDEKFRNLPEVSQRAMSAWDWAVARRGQIPGALTDISSGRDYFGRKVEEHVLLYVTGSLLPIAAQEVSESLRREDEKSVVAMSSGIALLGTSPLPPRRTSELARALAPERARIDARREAVSAASPQPYPPEERRWDGTWDDLWPLEKADLQRRDTGRAINEKYGLTQAQEFRNKIDILSDMQVQSDEYFASRQGPHGRPYSPDQWKRDYDAVRERHNILLQEMAEDFDFPARQPRDEKEQALAQLFAAREKFFQDVGKDAKGRPLPPNWDKLGEITESIKSSWPEWVRDWVDNNTGHIALQTPLAAEYDRIKRTLEREQYYSILDQFSPPAPVRNILVPYDAIGFADFKLLSGPDQIVARRKFPEYAVWEQMERKARIAWRFNNPDLERVMLKFGLVGVPVSQELRKELPELFSPTTRVEVETTRRRRRLKGLGGLGK